jgi:hypothetical protein
MPSSFALATNSLIRKRVAYLAVLLQGSLFFQLSNATLRRRKLLRLSSIRRHDHRDRRDESLYTKPSLALRRAKRVALLSKALVSVVRARRAATAQVQIGAKTRDSLISRERICTFGTDAAGIGLDAVTVFSMTYGGGCRWKPRAARSDTEWGHQGNTTKRSLVAAKQLRCFAKDPPNGPS